MSKSKKEVRKVRAIQKYTFEIVHYEDGTSVMNRNNDGFSVIELLGMASLVTNNMLNIFQDAVKADEINLASTNSPLSHQPK